MQLDQEAIRLELEAARKGQSKLAPADFDFYLKNVKGLVEPDIRGPIMAQYQQAWEEGAPIRAQSAPVAEQQAAPAQEEAVQPAPVQEVPVKAPGFSIQRVLELMRGANKKRDTALDEVVKE